MNSLPKALAIAALFAVLHAHAGPSDAGSAPASIPAHEWYIYPFVDARGAQLFSLEKDGAPGKPSRKLDFKGLQRALDVVTPGEWVRWVPSSKRTPAPNLKTPEIVGPLKELLARRDIHLVDPLENTPVFTTNVISISESNPRVARVEFINHSAYALEVSTTGLYQACRFTDLTAGPKTEVCPWERSIRTIPLPLEHTFPPPEVACEPPTQGETRFSGAWVIKPSRCSQPVKEAQSAPVILITMDGVRREDFDDATVFPKLHARKDGKASGFEVSTPTLVSLPAYQSIFEGKLTDCDNNDCPKVTDETFLERIARELKLAPSQVAVFASWKQVGRAVARDLSVIHVDVGLGEGDDPAPPWRRARFDRATWAKAMRYLAEQKPRLLYVSFDDADEWAHRDNREEYVASLRRYDAWLDEMLDREKDAVVIVTTDHGRGAEKNWTEHGEEYPTAKPIWIWTRGLPKDTVLRNHLDLRPAVEGVFGLSR